MVFQNVVLQEIVGQEVEVQATRDPVVRLVESVLGSRINDPMHLKVLGTYLPSKLPNMPRCNDHYLCLHLTLSLKSALASHNPTPARSPVFPHLRNTNSSILTRNTLLHTSRCRVLLPRALPLAVRLIYAETPLTKLPNRNVCLRLQTGARKSTTKRLRRL
eukprot:Rmarinus@m.23990